MVSKKHLGYISKWLSCIVDFGSYQSPFQGAIRILNAMFGLLSLLCLIPVVHQLQRTDTKTEQSRAFCYEQSARSEWPKDKAQWRVDAFWLSFIYRVF